jgi:membrane protease YdiL (CAAX protease family)
VTSGAAGAATDQLIPPSGLRGRAAAAFRRHPLVVFFLLTFVLTWSLVPFGSFAAFGPLVAAFAVAAVTGGRTALRAWARQLVNWRVSPRWYVVAVVLPLLVLAVAVAVNVAAGAPVSAVHKLGAWHSILLFAVIRVIVPLFAPLGEEPGWRGFALPRLQQRRSPFQATLILAPLVVLWHVPLLFLASEKLAPILLLGTAAVTFFYTWIYNRSGGSVLVTVLAHGAEGTIRLGAFGFLGADAARLPWLYTAGWCAVAIGLLACDRAFWLGRSAGSVRPWGRPKAGLPAVGPAQ